MSFQLSHYVTCRYKENARKTDKNRCQLIILKGSIKLLRKNRRKLDHTLIYCDRGNLYGSLGT